MTADNQREQSESIQPHSNALKDAIEEDIVQAGTMQDYLNNILGFHLLRSPDGSESYSPEALQMNSLASLITSYRRFEDESAKFAFFSGELLADAVCRKLLDTEVWSEAAHRLTSEYLTDHLREIHNIVPLQTSGDNIQALADFMLGELSDEQDNLLPDEFEVMIDDWAKRLSPNEADQDYIKMGFRLIMHLVVRKPNEGTDIDSLSPKEIEERFESIMRNSTGDNGQSLLVAHDRFMQEGAKEMTKLMQEIEDYTEWCYSRVDSNDFLNSPLAEQLRILDNLMARAEAIMTHHFGETAPHLVIECDSFYVTPIDIPKDFDWEKNLVWVSENPTEDDIPQGTLDDICIPERIQHALHSFETMNDLPISSGIPMLVLRNGDELYWISFEMLRDFI